MSRFLLNNETDGDGIYHVHHTTCGYKPASNYTNLKATTEREALREAREIKKDAQGCSHCFESK